MKHNHDGDVKADVNANVNIDIPIEKLTALIDLTYHSVLVIIAAGTVSHIVKSFFPHK